MSCVPIDFIRAPRVMRSNSLLVRCVDRRERVPELVSEHRQELVLPPGAVLELRGQGFLRLGDTLEFSDVTDRLQRD